MSEKLEIDWEGYPKGVEEWLWKQKAPITIFCYHGEIMYTIGPGPWEAYHEAGNKERQEEWERMEKLLYPDDDEGLDVEDIIQKWEQDNAYSTSGKQQMLKAYLVAYIKNILNRIRA